MSGKYTTGKQPCESFVAQMDGNAYATWANEHQCYKCGGLVSFCETCAYDHHAGGYETCQRESASRGPVNHVTPGEE